MTNLADPQFLYVDLFLITPVAVFSKHSSILVYVSVFLFFIVHYLFSECQQSI